MTNTLKWLLAVLVIVIVVGLGFFIWRNINQTKVVATDFVPAPTITASITALAQIPAGDYTVVVKENADKTKSDIYLQKDQNSPEIFFMTVANVIEKSMSSAYVAGNVYVIHRSNPDDQASWTDEIWRYNRANPNGEKLYSAKGLGFMVSPNENYIAVIPSPTSTDTSAKIVLLDKAGNELKTFTENIADIEIVGMDSWNGDIFWATKGVMTMVNTLIKINPADLTIKEYAFDAPRHEFVINSVGTYTVWSSYPFLFDVDTAKQFEVDKTEVTLNLYNLLTGKNKVIATAGGKNFSFKWIDDTNFSYVDPATNQTVNKSVN